MSQYAATVHFYVNARGEVFAGSKLRTWTTKKETDQGVYRLALDGMIYVSAGCWAPIQKAYRPYHAAIAAAQEKALEMESLVQK